MAKAYYESKDKTSRKFWEIETKGKTVTVRFGKVGTDGQTKVKTFESSKDSTAHAAKVIAEKLNKGYKQAAAAPAGVRASSVRHGEAPREQTVIRTGLSTKTVRPVGAVLSFNGCIEYDVEEATLSDGSQGWVVWYNTADFRVTLKFPGDAPNYVSFVRHRVWDTECLKVDSIDFGDFNGKGSYRFRLDGKARFVEADASEFDEYGGGLGSVIVARDDSCLLRSESYLILSDGSQEPDLFGYPGVGELLAKGRLPAPKPPVYGPLEWLKYLVHQTPLGNKATKATKR